MATTIHNSNNFGKLGAWLFTRQTPMVAAKRHAGLMASFQAWRIQRAASAKLASLSDRELADIGVSRQEIPVVVRGQR